MRGSAAHCCSGLRVSDRSLLTARFAYGTVGNGAAPHGSATSSAASARRSSIRSMTRVVSKHRRIRSAARRGLTFASYRLGVPVDPVEAFYAGATTDFFQTQRRSYGVGAARSACPPSPHWARRR